MPTDYVIAESSTQSVPVSFSVKGNEVNKTKADFEDFLVVVDMNSVLYRENGELIDVSYSPNVFAKPQISNLLKSNINFTIPLDSIYLTLEKSLTKKVPITSDFTYTIEDIFMLTQTSGFDTDSVEITGLAGAIENITEIYVGRKNLGAINKPTVLNIDLHEIHPDIKIVPDNICFTVDILLATQGEAVVNLIDKHNPSYRFFPSNIRIKYSTSIDDFDNIIAEDFVLDIDYHKKDNRAFVNLSKFPQTVKIISIEPDFVEYYVFEE